jgi:hypothetical protein
MADKVITREEGVASVELGKDAGQTPHVDGGAIAQAQHDLRGAVEAALDVAVHLPPLKTTAAKVNHLSSSTKASEKGHIDGGLITAICEEMKGDDVTNARCRTLMAARELCNLSRRLHLFMLTASDQLATFVQALLMCQQGFVVCERSDISDELLKTQRKMPTQMH